jgi:hypothetical protein
MKFPSFIGGFYTGESPTALAARTMNWYVENVEAPGGRNKQVLYPTPGVRTFVDTAGLNGRGAFAQSGRAFFAIGNKLFEVFADFTAIDRGTMVTDSNPVTIQSNGDGGDELFITSGDHGYVYDLSANTLTQVVSSGATQGGMLDGYFLRIDALNSTLYISDLLDGTTWDPTQFAQRSIAPDPWIGMAVNYREIWLFGTETSEVWYDAGTSPFPFAPHPSGLVPYGITATFSVKNVNGTLIWLARTKSGRGQVVAAQGFNPKVISTHALQVAIDSYEEITDAVGDTFDFFGHTFYLLTFPSAQASWLYDLTTGVWTEIGTWVSGLNDYIAWRPLFHCFAFNKHLIADRASGTVMELSTAFGTDIEGRSIRRLRQAPVPMQELKRVFIREFSLYMETGLPFDPVPPSVTTVTSAEQYRASVLANGAEAYWTLNETSGDLLQDDASNGHEVMLMGPGVPTYAVAGAIGGGTIGLGFADPLGVSGTLTDLDVFIPGEGGAIEFWIRPTANSALPSLLVGNEDALGAVTGVVVQAGLTLALQGGAATTPLIAGGLYHAVLSVDAAGLATWFLNGVANGTTSVTGPIAINRLFGTQINPGPRALLAGLVDCLAIYPAPLSQATALDHYQLGLGLGQSSEPLVALRKSGDGAKTWGNERTRGTGKIGKYKTRVFWSNCGSGRDPYIEIAVSDTIPWRLVDAFIEMDGGRS